MLSSIITASCVTYYSLPESCKTLLGDCTTRIQSLLRRLGIRKSLVEEDGGGRKLNIAFTIEIASHLLQLQDCITSASLSRSLPCLSILPITSTGMSLHGYQAQSAGRMQKKKEKTLSVGAEQAVTLVVASTLPSHISDAYQQDQPLQQNDDSCLSSRQHQPPSRIMLTSNPIIHWIRH